MDTKPVYPIIGKETIEQMKNANRSEIEASSCQLCAAELHWFHPWSGTGWSTKFNEIGEKDDGVLGFSSTSKQTY